MVRVGKTKFELLIRCEDHLDQICRRVKMQIALRILQEIAWEIFTATAKYGY